MKTTKHFYLTTIFLGGLILFLPVISCKKITSPIENLQLLVDYNIIKTTVDIHFYDGTTNQMLGSAASTNATVTIEGRDKDAVVDLMGFRPANYRIAITRGIVSMALIPSAAYAPSPTNLVKYNIIAQVPGYLTTTQQLSISKVGRNFFRVNIMPIANPPAGVTVVVNNTAATAQNGVVNTPATVTLPGGAASLAIPSGIVMKDDGGTPLSGALNVTVVHFNNTSATAMQNFPGGLTPTVLLNNGSTQSGMFYSAGLAAITITDPSGRSASQFTNGSLELVSQISPQTINPNTQSTIVAGTVVPVWSLNENTGVWKEEGTATAVSTGGELKFTLQITHLSYFNIGWFTGTLCTSGKSFRFNTNTALPGPFLIKGHVYRQLDNAFIKTISFYVTDNQPMASTQLPEGVPVRIVWDTENTSVINVAPSSQPTLLDDMCGTGTVDVNLIVNSSVNFTTVRLELSVFCASQPNVILKPSFMANCQNIAGGPIIPVAMIEGKANVPGIILGDTYYVWVVYKGKEYGKDVVIDQASYSAIDVEIPQEVCSALLGGGN